MPGSDSLVLLAPVDGRPTAKRIYRSELADGTPGPLASEVAPLATWFRAETVPLTGPQDLFTALEAVSQDQTGAWYLVRGAVKEGVDPASLRRRHVGDEASLEPRPRSWVLLDLDRWREEVKAEDFAADPAKYAQEARQALPVAFRDVACWWQATSSAGVKQGVRLRLAFWLSRPVSDTEWKAWSEAWTVTVDRSLFTPSQPHFVAPPRLDGIPDPVQGPRSGVLPGSDAVSVPDLAMERPATALFAADDDLVKAARRVKKAPEGERRNTLNRAAYALAARWAEDELSARKIADVLSQAAYENSLPGHEAEATLQAAIRDGRAKALAVRAGWREMLARDDKTDKTRDTAANVSLFLEHHEAFAGKLAYDERAHRPIWLSASPWGSTGPVTEADEVRAVEWFQVQAHVQAKAAWVRSGVLKAAQGRTFDPIQAYLGALPEWDGTARLDTFFMRHLGVEDTALFRAQTAAWFIQAVRRAFATAESPVQADYLIVLSGETGLGKSSVLRALCPLPRFFRDRMPDIRDKDAALAIADAWIVELAEMTQRKADRDAFKAFITARVDKFRRPYGRDEIEAPRRAVLIGTVNEPEFLTDPTGNRRFWPMMCRHHANILSVELERDQLWAEAVLRATAGEPAYLTPELELQAKQVQEDHREEDSVEGLLDVALRRSAGGPFEGVQWEPGQLVGKRISWLTSLQACTLIGLDPRNGLAVGRIKAALRRLGWAEVRGQGRKRAWTAPPNWVYSSGEEKVNAQN